MPKNIHTPRKDLICGKLDILDEFIKNNGSTISILYLIEDIREDAIRMENKLILRKQEVMLLNRKTK